MNVFLDHLTSIAAGSVVLVILAATVLTRTEESQETTRNYITQQALSSFTDVLEADLKNLGVQLPVDGKAIERFDADRFDFRGLDGPDGTPALITYQRTPIGTLDGLTLYRVDRFVNGTAAGSVPGGITRFDLSLLDNRGAVLPMTSLDAARQIRVRVEHAIAYAPTDSRKERETLRVQGWSSTLRPLALQ